MIYAKVYHQKDEIYAFQLEGHAGSAEYGRDIVCAAVSILVLNTLNAIDHFTEVPFSCEVDEENGGYLRAEFPEEARRDPSCRLLVDTMLLGLADLEKEYESYITLEYEEVQTCSD